MGEQILFECQLCGSTHETRKGAKIHISNGGDDTHADKKGTDKGVIQEITDTSEFEELNKRTDHEGEERVEVTRGNSTYKGSATGLDATMSHIGERTIRELNVTERVPLLLTPDEISDLLSPEPMSRSLRRNIVNQLVNVEGLEADE